MKFYGAANRFRPGAHIPKADTPPGQQPMTAWNKSDPVVAHAQYQLAPFTGEIYRYHSGLGMLSDVIQRFLGDPEKCQLHLRLNICGNVFDLQSYLDSRPLFKLAAKHAQGWF